MRSCCTRALHADPETQRFDHPLLTEAFHLNVILTGG